MEKCVSAKRELPPSNRAASNPIFISCGSFVHAHHTGTLIAGRNSLKQMED
jgi:hypothetical protein